MIQLKKLNDFDVRLNIIGAKKYGKVSYPVRYGAYSEIETDDHLYQFNLNGEIKYLQGKNKKWPADEWLKRTAGNDWIYYTPGIYTGIESFIGEYYLPCFSYESNSIFAYDPFENNYVKEAIDSLSDLFYTIKLKKLSTLSNESRGFIRLIRKNSHSALESRSKRLHKIIGGRVTVLPPDTRHVDYDVIPVNISRGCIYNCGFCMIKSGNRFTALSSNEITDQIGNLKEFYGNDLINYNSVFLGEHDALFAGRDVLTFSAMSTFEILGLKNSLMYGSNLFFFGSVNSFLGSADSLFKELNKLPFYTYINIGLESAHPDTLKRLGKSVDAKSVEESFQKMISVNKKYENIEVTSNFLIGSSMPEEHYDSILKLSLKNDSFYSKGALYLSPLQNERSVVELQMKFKKIKNCVRIPAYLYLIQRL